MPTIHHVPQAEFDRVWKVDAPATDVAGLFADMCRINALYMIMRAGSGHIGSSFSSLDIVTWLYLHELRIHDAIGPDDLAGTYFSSKGHDVPGLYAVLAGAGRLQFDLIHSLRRLGGLPGHPDVATPWIEANTGPLGMGVSKAKGMAEANRLRRRPKPIFVLTGDGELQEGQFWESLQGAVNRRLGEITVIVDHNKIQSDTWVTKVSDLGDLEAKFGAFGWKVARCDGHDLPAVARCLAELRAETDVPGVLVADTVKGRGVSFMEEFPADGDLYDFHSGAPSQDDYDRALAELATRCGTELDRLGEPALQLVAVDVPPRPAASGQRLVAAYGRALRDQARVDDRIVALDGDLVLDTGLIPFRKEFPDRFFEAGIAEQDMVSQAGGMALAGLLPVVHSFACFLSMRPAEQIFNNATEGTRVVYVGSLAGLIPAGPGHSHQALRDVAAFSSVPGLTVAEPCHEAEVAPLLAACLHEVPGSAYLRLVSAPVVVPFDLPAGYRPVVGRGVAVRDGAGIVAIAAGPVALSQTFEAAELLAERGLEITVVNLPWHNVVDMPWLEALTAGCAGVVVVDNHDVIGGQGQMVLAALATLGRSTPCRQIGVMGVPACGTPAEVLRAHGLDAASIATTVAAFAEAL